MFPAIHRHVFLFFALSSTLLRGFLCLSDCFSTEGTRNGVVITDLSCINYTVAYHWSQPSNAEAILELHCYNDSDNFNLISGPSVVDGERRVELPLGGTVYCEISGCYEDRQFHQWTSPNPQISFTCEAPFSVDNCYDNGSQLGVTGKTVCCERGISSSRLSPVSSSSPLPLETVAVPSSTVVTMLQDNSKTPENIGDSKTLQYSFDLRVVITVPLAVVFCGIAVLVLSIAIFTLSPRDNRKYLAREFGSDKFDPDRKPPLRDLSSPVIGSTYTLYEETYTLLHTPTTVETDLLTASENDQSSIQSDPPSLPPQGSNTPSEPGDSNSNTAPDFTATATNTNTSVPITSYNTSSADSYVPDASVVTTEDTSHTHMEVDFLYSSGDEQAGTQNSDILPSMANERDRDTNCRDDENYRKSSKEDLTSATNSNSIPTVTSSNELREPLSKTEEFGGHPQSRLGDDILEEFQRIHDRCDNDEVLASVVDKFAGIGGVSDSTSGSGFSTDTSGNYIYTANTHSTEH